MAGANQHLLSARTGRRFAGRILISVAMLGAGAGAGATVTQAAEAHPVLTAVGDITTCGDTSDDATAALAAQVPGPIAALGDLVEGKAANEYRDCFEPSWGFLKNRIRPVPGDNGEYGRGSGSSFEGAVPQLDDYHAYFGAAAGSPDQRWYSYDVGSWHIVALDVNCSDEEGGCTADSPQARWLEADLAAHPRQCVAVAMHHNFIEEPGRVFGSLKPLLDPMYRHGVDVVLSGHRHTYRRYAPVDMSGERDEALGIRQFVVGTGGHSRNAGKVTQGGELEVSHGDSWGVLRLTLKPTGYDWKFVSAGVEKSDGTFTDSGSTACHWGPAGAPSTTTTSTTAPPPTTTTTAPRTTPDTSPAPPAERSGYWMLGGEGAIYPFGDAEHMGDPRSRMVNSEAVDLEPTRTYRGYWVVDRNGRVFPFGDAVDHGSVDRSLLDDTERVTSLSATPTGRGYWVFTTRGKVIALGDAVNYGDMSQTRLNGPVLDSIPTASGKGYYMVASDGGIFAFGDAAFHGSMGGVPLNAPVQSLVPDGDGVGYWLVASDGGIFAFEAPFRGSMGDRILNRPVTGMVRFGNGYLMVGEDGGIFNFSDKDFYGSLGDNPPPRPIVSVAALDG